MAARIGPMHGVSERESEPDRVSARQTNGLRHLHPLLAHQPGDRRQPQEMQPHDDDGDAGDDRELAE